MANTEWPTVTTVAIGNGKALHSTYSSEPLYSAGWTFCGKRGYLQPATDGTPCKSCTAVEAERQASLELLNA